MENITNISLINKIAQKENLLQAFQKVKSNKGVAGIDNVSIKTFETELNNKIGIISNNLLTGRYTPNKIKRVFIPKANGKKRPLGIPTVQDRVVQQAILNVVEKQFENSFYELSYGFRKGRNCHMALGKVRKFIQKGYCYAIKIDMSNYFDTLNHEIVMKKIKDKIRDEKLLTLIFKFLKVEKIFKNGFRKEIIKSTEGVPQGGVISPLIANIYLTEFDKYIGKDYKIIRYADDFVILCKTMLEAKLCYIKAGEYLEQKLFLKINRNKSKIVRLNNSEPLEFLGVQIKLINNKVDIKPTNEAINKFKNNIIEEIAENKNKNNTLVKNLNLIIRGWGHYYKLGNIRELYKGLDRFVRMKLRNYWKSKYEIANIKALRYTLFYSQLGLCSLSELYHSSRVKKQYRKIITGLI